MYNRSHILRLSIFTTYFIKTEDSTKPLQISVGVFKYNKILSSTALIRRQFYPCEEVSVSQRAGQWEWGAPKLAYTDLLG